MSTRQAYQQILRSICLILALFAVSEETRPQGTNQSTSTPEASSGTTRECAENPTFRAKGKKPSKSKQPSLPEPAADCLEVKGQAIEVQEFLQTMGREHSWRMTESRASEESWSFVRYFDASELDSYANTKEYADSVKFTSGKAAVTILTTGVEGGFVRVQIIALFQGEGKSIDRILVQPGKRWPLASNGLLEKELIKALQTKYRPLV